MPVTALLQDYAHRIENSAGRTPMWRRRHWRRHFQRLLEGLIAFLPVAPGLVVAPEFRNPGVGRPDIALVRPGAPARAFVELKAPAKPADRTRWRGHDQRQFERLKELACWASCNFSELRLFRRNDEIGRRGRRPEGQPPSRPR